MKGPPGAVPPELPACGDMPEGTTVHPSTASPHPSSVSLQETGVVVWGPAPRLRQKAYLATTKSSHSQGSKDSLSSPLYG